MKMRPLTTVGWLYISVAYGIPNAHFNFKCGTWSAVRPAACADWKRALMASLLQPFQTAPAEGSPIGGFVVQRLDIAFASPTPATPKGRPPRCWAIKRFWSSVKSLACTLMEPLVMDA